MSYNNRTRFIIYKFLGNFTQQILLLLFIAFFVWIGAAQETGIAQMRSAVGRIPVQQAMMTDFKVLHRNDSLDRAIELTLAGAQMDFPLVDSGFRPL